MIRIISASTVRPERVKGDEEEDESSRARIDLGPSDIQLLMVDHIQKGLLFHKPPTAATTLSLVSRLKDSFAHAVNVFYPLAGRLLSVDNNDDTKSFFIDCNCAGAEFVHATADGSVTAADILDPVLVPDAPVYSFFTMNDVLNYEAAISDLPLLSVQVTELADAVFVACSVNHCVSDGSFFWHFFRTWSDISRDGIEVSDLHKHRVFGRGFLDGIVGDLPIRIPKRSLVADEAFKRPSPGQLGQRMFRFSKATLAELKARANAEVGRERAEISSLQSLLAHLWIAITRSRALSFEEVVIYVVAVGLRQRMGLPENLPEEYLGNAVRVLVVKSTAGEVVQRGLGAAALLINRVIASQTVLEVKSYLKAWAESPEVHRRRPLTTNKLLTGSSPRFDVYGCDFGWGKPVAVRSGPGNKSDGKLTVFPGSEQGSIDLEACLSTLTLQALDSDPDFTRTLS